MSAEGWAAINFNWSKDSIAVFLGCRTLPWVKNIFIKVQPAVGWAAGNRNDSRASKNPTSAPYRNPEMDRNVYFVGTAFSNETINFWIKMYEPLHVIDKDGVARITDPATDKDYVLQQDPDTFIYPQRPPL